MDPLWLVALHVAAAMTWIAGMILLGLADPGSDTAAGLRRARTWNRLVTTPAMLLTWVLGVTLATRGGWFGEPWLWAKLILVLALSALHGRLSGRLRRHVATDPGDGAAVVPLTPSLVAAAAIVVLAFVKPF